MQEKRRRQRRAWLHPEPARPDLRDPWGDWLNRLPWDWYGTFTFADLVHPDQAAQRYHRWAELLCTQTEKVMQHARALEYQRRGVIHFHALIHNVNRHTHRKEWEAKWQEVGGGFAAIYPFDRALGATYYLGKYVTKNGEVDMLAFGASAWRPDDVRIQRGP